MKHFPESGLKIFTGEGCSDTSDIEQLPRGRVFDFIRKTNRDMAIPYLEHIIWEWGDTTPDLHNKLIQMYKEKILRYPRPNEDSTEEQRQERQRLREDLQKMLKMSKSYEPERVIVHFPHDFENGNALFYFFHRWPLCTCLFFFTDLSEEKAIIFGQLGQHEKALKLYVNVLDDINMALDYCHHQYNSKSGKMVILIYYFILVRLIVFFLHSGLHYVDTIIDWVF